MSPRSNTLLASTMLTWVTVLSATPATTQPSSSVEGMQPSQSVEQQPVPTFQLSSSASEALFLMSATGVNPSDLRPIREIVVSSAITSASKDPDVSSVSGKLHFTINGTAHYCSGVFVGDDVIVTAAHCVQQNGTPTRYQIQKFVKEPPVPQDFFVKKDFNNQDCVRVPAEWATQTDEYLRINHDYAFIKLTSTVSPSPKVMLVSSDPYNRQIKAYGYPASLAPTPGSEPLTAIAAETVQDVLHPGVVGLASTDLGFTQGTSGGAWVLNPVSAGQPFRVASVNSSYALPVYDKTRIWIYGPNFDRSSVSGIAASATSCY